MVLGPDAPLVLKAEGPDANPPGDSAPIPNSIIFYISDGQKYQTKPL